MKIRKQNGLTLIGFLLVLALGLFFAYTAMRVIPMYLEYHALGNALETVRKDPNAADMTAGQIRNKIINSLWVSYSSNNIKREHIRISRNNGIQVRVVYDVRVPWIGNLDLIGQFDKSVILKK